MAIFHKTSDTAFSEALDVYKKESTLNKIQRVWVHDGTKFVLVKGRMYEVVWETDLSEWGGVSWDGDYYFRPSNNICEDMYILDDGSLLAVMPEYLDNYGENCTNAGRYALAKFDSNTGAMSKWGNSNWVSWETSAKYINHLQPHFLIKLPNYFVFYTGDFGIFYMYNMTGSYVSRFYNSTWGTSGDFNADYGNRAIANPLSSSGNIYAGVQWGDSYERTCCYRLGYSGSSFYNKMYRFHSGYTENDYVEAKPFYLQGTGKVLISYIDTGYYGYCHIVILNEITSYSSTTTDRTALVSLKVEGAIEIPLYYKDGYVYLYHSPPTSDSFTIVKRNITDLSLVWEVSIKEPHFLSNMYGWSNGCKKTCEPYGDNAFITDFGLVVYENGRTEIPKDYTESYFNPDGYGYYDVRISTGAFNQDGGYAMIFNSTDEVCSMLKLKEVRK